VLIHLHDPETRGGVARLRAEITWETAERPPFEVFVETFATDALRPDPNAFFLACVVPAWKAGEKRVAIDGTLCPALLLRSRTAFAVLAGWFSDLGPLPEIEAQGVEARTPGGGGALELFSCGIDSLATLRWSTLNLPPEHPSAIRAVAPIYFHASSSRNDAELRRTLRPLLDAAEPVAADAGVELLPAATNIWGLVNDGWFYSQMWYGALLAGVGHLFSARFGRAYIAAGRPVARLRPEGSHPFVDAAYSSAHMDVELHGVEQTRLEKTALVADWPAALQHIRVCQKGQNWPGNCGTCEKCIRTMLELIAVGKLDGCAAFPADDVSVELVRSVVEYEMLRPDQLFWYRELVPALAARGRQDLAREVEEVVRHFEG
jgi:hypothetical protein